MKVVYLAAGAAGMYCGSCLRDNRLGATLIARGRDFSLVPLYTPIRTDETDVSESRVFYGGINVFLQQAHSVFRHAPRWMDRILDNRVLLDGLSRFASGTDPATLGALTVSVLRGEHGAQRKELDKLVAGMQAVKPDVINLANLMFLGLTRALKDALGASVICTLSGEDIFLDKLPEPHRSAAFELIEQGGRDVDGFVAVTKYVAGHAANHFSLPPDRIHYARMGIHVDDFRAAAPPDNPFTIGYLARICPEKGLAELCEAFALLRKTGRSCRLRVAGYLGASDRPYFDRVKAYCGEHGISDDVDFIGEIDRGAKIEFLGQCHLLSVPATFPESKGLYILEAMAAGVPVVQPRIGSFPELIEATQGGLLYDPEGPHSLADAITKLMDDVSLRKRLAQQGRSAVRESFTDEQMADDTWRIYERCGGRGARPPEPC
ncbi:MAG: glycosyltransferase family 4 protein [Planctomycetota bacterium]|nr:glycosyltransferase family 4 protein [Planctomycetota bacterium]